jgi:hypothetical protein
MPGRCGAFQLRNGILGRTRASIGIPMIYEFESLGSNRELIPLGCSCIYAVG